MKNTSRPWEQNCHLLWYKMSRPLQYFFSLWNPGSGPKYLLQQIYLYQYDYNMGQIYKFIIFYLFCVHANKFHRINLRWLTILLTRKKVRFQFATRFMKTLPCKPIFRFVGKRSQKTSWKNWCKMMQTEKRCKTIKAKNRVTNWSCFYLVKSSSIPLDFHDFILQNSFS